MTGRILTVLLFLLPYWGWTGEVRTLVPDGSQMGTINLALGRSTVLSFEEPPQKIVVGNKNYFNFEFVKNDLTIQPTDRVESNLFVYGKKRSWGFLLRFPKDGSYDDWVKVAERLPMSRTIPKVPARGAIRVFTTRGGLRVVRHPPKPSPVGTGVWLVDFELMNVSDKSVLIKRIVPTLPRVPVCASGETRIILDRAVLGTGQRGRARMFCEDGGR